MVNHSSIRWCYNFLDWFTWWDTQVDHGYYESCHFKKFEKLLKADRQIISAALSSELWKDMEEEESHFISFISSLCLIF